MKTNIQFARFLQVLIEQLVPYIHSQEDINFVRETLDMTNACLEGQEVDSDLLYSRLENLEEEDILTYFERDDITPPEVWICIADAVAYICLLNYEQSGGKYLPETIEAVDNQTIVEFFENYKQCLRLFPNLDYLKSELMTRQHIDWNQAMIREKMLSLFS